MRRLIAVAKRRLLGRHQTTSMESVFQARLADLHDQNKVLKGEQQRSFLIIQGLKDKISRLEDEIDNLRQRLEP